MEAPIVDALRGAQSVIPIKTRSAFVSANAVNAPRAYTLICALFSPKGRIDRRGFARGLALLGALALGVWQLLDPIADAEWISDAALLWIGQGISVLSGFWIIALLALSARRAHDLGLSGAWGLLVAVPPINLPALLLGLVLPGGLSGEQR